MATCTCGEVIWRFILLRAGWLDGLGIETAWPLLGQSIHGVNAINSDSCILLADPIH